VTHLKLQKSQKGDITHQHIIIINLFATNQNIHNNHRVYMMAGRQKN